MEMLGSILLQPQMLARMQGRNAAEDLFDEFIALGQLLAMNPQALGAVAPAFESASKAFSEALLTRVEAKLPQALAELRELADPVITSLVGFTGGGAPKSAPDVLTRIADGLSGLAAVAGLLSDEQIRVTVRRVSAILTGTLGLSQAGFRDDFIAMLAATRQKLREGNAAMTNETAAVRESLACFIARLETDIYPRFPTLDLNPDRLAELLIGALRGTPLSAALGKTECLLDKLKAVLLAVADIARTVAAAEVAIPKAVPQVMPANRAARRGRTARAAPRAGGVPGRDADDRYLWYASWLYATRHQGFENGAGTGLVQSIVPGYPGDEIWQTADKKQLIYRRAGADDQILHQSDTPFEWHQAPQFAGPASTEFFSFGAIGPEFLEVWSQVTSVLAKFASGLWHVIAMGLSPKEFACNIPLWLWNWTDAVARGGGGAPLPSLISKAAGTGVGLNWLFSTLVPLLIVSGCSVEGVHTKTTTKLAFMQWLTLIGGDAISAFTITALPNAVRDFSLSLFTLINQTGPGGANAAMEDTRPKNWDMADPVIGLVNLGSGMLFHALIPRDDYGLPFNNDGEFSFGPLYFPWWLLGAPLVNAFSNMFGTFLAWGIARTATPAQLGEKVGLGTLMGTLTFVIEFYGNKEGSTDDGKYNPKIKPDGTPYPGTPRVDFAGYPKKATSPYRLPYPKDQAMYVGQANLGFFSHARYNTLPQVYAYDFAHDFQDEILAVRDGTVVDFFDWIPDNINPDTATANTARTASNAVMGGAAWRTDDPTWNFITIRHDTANGDHDKDQGGAATTTYATYGHGATEGVRKLWQSLYGKGPGQIIGTRVVRGNPVMQAGSTGVSFHNHLHLHIQGGPAASAAAPPPPLTEYTLPFVFGEASGDGVLKNLTWYKSDNPRTTTLPP